MQAFTKKLFAILFMAMVLFAGTPHQAFAQWTTTNPDVVAGDAAKIANEQIQDKTEGALVGALTAIGINMLNYVAQLTAKSTAIWIANGAAGQHPLFNKKTMAEVGENLSATLTSDVLDEMIPGSKYMMALGIDPDNPDATGIARKFLYSPYIENDNEFNGSEIARNFGSYTASIHAQFPNADASAKILSDMANSYNVNEFYGTLRIYGQTKARAGRIQELGELQHLIDGGFQDLTDPISGYTKYPAQLVQQELTSALESAKSTGSDTANALVAAGGTDALIGVGINFAATFVQTLFGGLMQKLYMGLFEDIDPVTFDPFDPNRVVKRDAEDLFKDLVSFSPLDTSNYSLTSELATCPGTLLRSSRGIYSCAIDTGFVSALARAEGGAPVTLIEAIDEGYVNGKWALVGSNSTVNQDPTCHKQAFCHSNLLKLRKARIIPVGWEIAAESSGEGQVTLEEVMENFHSCNSDGQRDDQHPYCHLIDPNWILKAPDSQCRTLAYGQVLAAVGTENRAEECVDIQTCIAEGDDGQCLGGYGYCVREKNVWRFRGDACPTEFASCLSFRERDGDQVDYLTNSVDYGDCGPDSVGCSWYATNKTVDDEAEYDWPTVNNITLADADEFAYKDRFFANANIETCSANEGGCSEIITRNNVTLNYVQNPGFEDDEEQNTRPDAWVALGQSGSLLSNQGFGGGNAFTPDANIPLEQFGIALESGYSYTLSAYAKSNIGGAGNGEISINLTEEFGEETLGFTGLDLQDGENTSCAFVGDSLVMVWSVDATNEDYNRYSCIFTAPILDGDIANLYGNIALIGTNIAIDDVQLEQNGAMTPFSFGYAAASGTDVVKLPPDYLGCTGDASDPAECASYAQICSESEVGCQLYTPTSGDPAVSGIVGVNDFCPNECVGYDTYKQEPTRYEPAGDFPLYFIPNSAETCSEDAVGCDEFTNLSTEEKEYYSYLRACVTPDQAATNTNSDGAAIYYTWEGTDVTGYQLKTWNLIESNIPEGDARYLNGFDGNPHSAPCTNWFASESGAVCNDDANGDFAIDGIVESCDERDDIFSNPDCREFYDVLGDIHYRTWSETVTVNAECSTYRKTTVAGADAVGRQLNCSESGGFYNINNGECHYYGFTDESDECKASENGCRSYTGGRSNNSRLAFEDLFEDGTLVAWDTDGASGVTYSNESIATDGHSLRSEGGQDVWTYFGNNGATCDVEGGCTQASGAFGTECTVIEGRQYCGTLHDSVFTGKTYTLSFWAKGTGVLEAGFDLDASGTPSIDAYFNTDVNGTRQQIELNTEWKRYEFGPLNMNTTNFPTFGDGSIFVFDGSATSLFFIDNVVLREGEDNLALIRDSWVTPASCDINAVGQFSPQYHLGCQEYTVPTGATLALRSFSRLCDESSIGCRGYYDTQESDNVYAEVRQATCSTVDGLAASNPIDCYLLNTGVAYDINSQRLCQINRGETSCQFDLDFFIPESELARAEFSHISYGPEAQYVSGDTPFYAIVDDADRCNSASAGCMEVGVPALSADQSRVDEWSTDHLINDPDQYESTLCGSDQVSCEEFDAGDAGKYYFKDPTTRRCEYKNDITVNGQQYDGWFVEGTNNFCYGTGTCSNDAAISCTADAECRDTVGTCSISGSACSQDAECRTGEACLGTSEGICEITSGDYIIAGVESGLWRNGDDDYEGWVGMCSPEYNGCSEFQDPLDFPEDQFYGNADIESYTFIDNNKLEEGGLLTSQRCNGQVSQTAGCTLFNDTSDPNLAYNASATVVASTHADELFGDQPFDLVDPIDCSNDSARTTIQMSNGQSVDLCAQVCVYDEARLNDIGATGAATNFVDRLPITAEEISDVYTFGGSCFTNNDCAPKLSLKGDQIEGRCLTEVDIDLVGGTTDIPRLENDTNRIVKVNRDRTCSEWIACSNSQPVWDPGLGQFREVCSDILLCEEYSQTGDTTFCKKWKLNDSAVFLDKNQYAGRDVSWYGEDYSGYSIPDTFPMQHLTQIEISKIGDVCHKDGEPAGLNPASCTTDLDCASSSSEVCGTNPDPDYALAYNAGSCEGVEHFGSCTVGYCSDNGSACSDNSQCLTGSCVTGVCYERGDICTSDAQCSGLGETCDVSAGVCKSATGEYCDGGADNVLDGTCGVGTCSFSEANRLGSCLNESCVLTPDNKPFAAQEEYEASICRAQPEIDAPFGEEIVDQWSQFGEGVTTSPDVNAVPYNVRSGFESVATCAPGETCECSYKKIESSAGTRTYIDSESTLDELEAKVKEAIEENNTSISDAKGDLGICSGGQFDGALCLTGAAGEYGCKEQQGGIDSQDITAASLGTCNPITREDTILGLKGFCLERDTGLNIEGDPDLGACLTWYPVDQIRGETDLFAKFIEAGFFEDTYYCSDIRTYTDVSSFLGCSAIRAVDDSSNAIISDDIIIGDQINNEWCRYTVKCPEGYWALVGRADNPVPGIADMCSRGGTLNIEESGGIAGLDLWNRGLDVCPFMCVPKNSVFTGVSLMSNVNNGDVCTPPVEGVDGSGSTNHGSPDTEFYYVREYREFDDYVDDYLTCTISGIEISGDPLGIRAFTGNQGLNPDGDIRYDLNNTGSYDVLTQNPFNHISYYPACQEIVQTADADDFESYSFSNRVWENSDYRLNGFLGEIYLSETVNAPFGATITPSDILNSDDPSPVKLPSCKPSDNKWINKNDFGTTGGGRLPTYAYPLHDGTIHQNDTPLQTCFDWTGKETAYEPNIGNEGVTEGMGFLRYGISPGGFTQLVDIDNMIGNLTLASGENTRTLVDRLSQIFAKPLSVIPFISQSEEVVIDANETLGYYDVVNDIDPTDRFYAVSGNQNWDVREIEGNPPKVWSVNLQNCIGDACVEQNEGFITVNGQDTGDIEVEGGFSRANVNFFAAADRNQLPIRRVIVDWGDGRSMSGSDAPDNFYKNHRGLEAGTKDIICNQGDEWGKTSESCEANYFSYNHTYTCDAIMIANLPACSASDPVNCVENKGGPGPETCVFQPQVHIRDNWGWCAGTCNGADGCFDGAPIVSGAGDDSLRNKCKYDSSNSNIDPWVSYNGALRILSK